MNGALPGISSPRQSSLRWLVLLFLVALVVRMAAIHWFAEPPQRDELDNHRIAVNLIEAKGYAIDPGHPTTYLQPVYPAFIASMYAIFWKDYRVVWYVQALLNASLVFLIFSLGRMVFSETVGLLAAGIFAVYPSYEIVTTLYRENLLIPILLGVFYCLVRGLREDRNVFFSLAGCFSGLLLLTNFVYFFLPLAFLSLSLLDRRLRPHLRQLVSVVLVAMALWLPWQMRNTLYPESHAEEDAYKHFTLMFGHYPVLSGEYWWALSDMVKLEQEREQARELLQRREQAAADLPLEDRIAKDKRDLIERILDRPVAYLKFVLNRDLIFLLSPPAGSSVLRGVHPTLALTVFWINALFVGTAVLFLLRTYWSDASVFPIVGTLAYLLVVYGLVHAIRRYGYVMESAWCVFGAATLYDWGTRYGWVSWRR